MENQGGSGGSGKSKTQDRKCRQGGKSSRRPDGEDETGFDGTEGRSGAG